MCACVCEMGGGRGEGVADTSFGEAERYIDVSERIFSWLCSSSECACGHMRSIHRVIMDMSFARTHTHLTWMLSG